MKFQEYFQQHRNLLVSMLVALAILTIGVVVNWKGLSHGTREQELPVGSALVSASSTTITDRDSDADGLPDWEEHLYNSDPLKFDSDADGTPDGEEIREGRDPSKANTAGKNAAPNDILAVAQDPHFATSSTDILGIKKEFFAKYLALDAQEIRQTIYKDLLKNFDVKKVTPTNQMVDLNISSDNSAEALHTYGNVFGLLIQKYTKRTHRTEQEIVADALKASSTQILKELQLPAIDYRNFSADLKKIPTPTSMAQWHLEIVNGYERMYLGLLSMQSLFLDPIVGAGGYQAYTQGKADLTEGYANVILIFNKEKIVFTRDEPGAPFYFTPNYNAATASSTINIDDL